MKTYSLKNLSDLFDIPQEKRAQCFRELEQSMLLAELAFGDDAPAYMQAFQWTDDGQRDTTLHVNGEEFLKLEVKDAPPVCQGERP